MVCKVLEPARLPCWREHDNAQELRRSFDDDRVASIPRTLADRRHSGRTTGRVYEVGLSVALESAGVEFVCDAAHCREHGAGLGSLVGEHAAKFKLLPYANGWGGWGE
jgi:hypothetical protein